MPIKLAPVVDSLDALPESVRHAYEQQGDRFVFAKEIEVEDLPSVAGMKSTMEKLKRREKELSDTLKNKEGLDPEEVAQMRSELETLRASKGNDKTEMDRAIATMKQNHEKELRIREDKIGSLNGKLQNREKDGQISEALAKYKPSDVGAHKALNRLLRDMLNVVEEDGELVTQVLDDKGKLRYSKKTGEPMTTAELVEEMASGDEYKSMFAGTGLSGGSNDQGSRREGGGGAGTITVSRAEFEANYRRYREQAQKLGKPITEYVIVRD
jgi:vacuolar-type H+-ATPase subunit I/STV1